MDGDTCHSLQQDRPLLTRKSSKSKAPPPPLGLHGQQMSSNNLLFSNPNMEQKEGLLEQDLLLTVVLPEGEEKVLSVQSSKPMMDLLVMLCAKYHLNPSSHALELVSANKNPIKYKPNALIGALEAEKVVLKPKGTDDKNKKTGPQMPQATVRMVINYKKTQKTVLRVNPQIALRELLPAISEKCEFEVQNTVLLQNVYSEQPLDLSSSLNDLGIRELYARDTQDISETRISPSLTFPDIQPGKDKLQKEKENKGLFSMFRRGSKKKPEQPSTMSAPASPLNRRSRPMSLSSLSMHSSSYEANTMPADTAKKRRAPLPPNMKPADLNHHHNSETSTYSDGKQVRGVLNRSLSAESSVKRSKRKAPPPPSSHSNPSDDHDEKTQRPSSQTDPTMTYEEIEDNQESVQVSAGPVSRSSSHESLSPVQELLEDDGSMNVSTDVSMAADKTEITSFSQGLENVPPEGSSQAVSRDLTKDIKLATASEVNGDPTEPQLQPTKNAAFDGGDHKAKSTAETSAAVTEPRTVPSDTSLNNAIQSPATSHIHALVQTQQAEPQVPPKPGCVAVSVQATLDIEPAVNDRTSVDIQTKAQESPKPSVSPKSISPLCFSSGSSKRDMGTSTEELRVLEMHPPMALKNQTSTQAHTNRQKCPQTQSTEVQNVPPMSSATKADDLRRVSSFQPKVTPNNLPKEGMTTYTVVPPRSLEKQRFFEVALTLESSSVPEAQGVSAEALVCKSPASPSSFQFENKPGSASELSNSVPSSPVSPQVKEKKAPPAIRPKPASFRIPQHNRSPGSYVNSAAVRSMSLSDSVHSPSSPKKETIPDAMEESFPSPPPPIQWKEDAERQHIPSIAPPKSVNQERSSSVLFKNVSTGMTRPILSHQTSLPPTGLSLEKLRSFAAPKPYSSNTPSRFAQAVSSAVRRSQSVVPQQTSSHKVPLALTKQAPVRETFPELSATRDVDDGYMQKESSGDYFTFPADDPADVWRRRTSDLSSVSASDAQNV